MSRPQRQRILALDVGTRSYGLALFDEDELTMSRQCRIRGATKPGRLARLAYEFDREVRSCLPCIVAIESGFVFLRGRDPKTGREWQNFKSNLTLAEGRGVAIAVAVRAGAVDVIEIAPSQAKKAATGKGNSAKRLVQISVEARWGLTATLEDEADAIAVGMAALSLLGPDNGK